MSVWQRQRNWWSEVLWKPKKQLSIDQLKYQYQVLLRNPTVTDNNKQTIVETFRSIAEILIWGDQNDSRVFDFFLEKNMQSFFLKILTQRCGRYVCLQLLQTLNILFENIRNETSIYYLLSNNHVNSIIVLKLDFSDEEVLAYYISFLKTLSFKLNKHTIHFFYNEHLRDFPLYTEAIKFFNHAESMVRIAVRTLTLNVYKVNDPAMLEYIHNKTAVPYFSNLVWFIGNHVIDLDECLISQAHHLNRGRLEQLVAEHLDHLHYISDILSLNVQSLNDVIIDHLLNRLLIPLYVYSLTDQALDSDDQSRGDNPRISSTISLFMLSQVFLILKCPEVVTPLAYLILTGDTTLTLPPALLQDTPPTRHRRDGSYSGIRGFVRPEASLATSLQKQRKKAAKTKPVQVLDRIRIAEDSNGGSSSQEEGSSTESQRHMTEAGVGVAASKGGAEGRGFSESRERSGSSLGDFVDVSIVDSQYVLIEPSSDSSRTSSVPESIFEAPRPKSPSSAPSEAKPCDPPVPDEAPIEEQQPSPNPDSPKPKQTPPTPQRLSPRHGIPVTSTVFLDVLMGALSVRNDDSRCLFTLCLLLAMIENEGVHPKLLEAFSLKSQPPGESGSPQYNSELVVLLLSTLDTATTASSCIRLVTLRLATMLLHRLLGTSNTSPQLEGAATASPLLQDHHVALIENIYESAILRLRLYYKGAHDEFFLDMFEDQFNHERQFQVKIPYLMMDASMLLPPTDTPLTGIDFTRRLPCGENEKAMNAMRVFFAIRTLSQQLQNVEECDLPLTPHANSAKQGDILDFNNCNLLSCLVFAGERRTQHFMVVTETEFLLVNPDRAKLGWGVVNFIAFLQDVDVTTDPADNCSLYVVCSRDSTHKRPALSAKFQFDDYIRCVSARQLLLRSKDNLRLAKMTRITKMLHLPPPEPSPTLSTATSSPATLVPPPSHAAALRQQTDNMGVISISPTPRGVLTGGDAPPPTTAQADLTSSMLTKTFLQPAATPFNTQEFEMNNFQFRRQSSGSQLHSLAEADAPVVYDSPVKLAPPIEEYSSGESSGHSLRESLDASLSNVHIGSDSLLVHFDNSSKSRTPDTLLEQSLDTEGEEGERHSQSSELSTLSEQMATPAEGYKVEQLGGGEVGVASLFDEAAAEEDKVMNVQPKVAIHQVSQAEGTTRDKMNIEHSTERMSSPHSQLLMSVEQGTDPLADEGGDPWSLAANRSSSDSRRGLRNGNIVSSRDQSLHHQLPMSSNIIWDVPLTEELTRHTQGEDSGSRTADSAVTNANHARVT